MTDDSWLGEVIYIILEKGFSELNTDADIHYELKEGSKHQTLIAIDTPEGTFEVYELSLKRLI